MAPAAVLPDAPPSDLADAWLEHALAHLTDAATAAEEQRRTAGARVAVALAALAVEARLNRVVRTRDPEGWAHDAQLDPLRKFQLLPRLLHEHDVSRHNELAEQLVEVFDLRSRLVDASDEGAVPTPSVACSTVAAAAAVCAYLGDPGGRAQAVLDAAVTLTPRAAAHAAEGEEDFPPDLVGS